VPTIAAIAAKLLIAMNDSRRRPRRPYPGLVASAEVRRSLLIGPLVLPRLPSLRCSVCVVRSLLPASEKRVAAHEECVGRFAKKKQLRRPRRSPGSCWHRAPQTCDPIPRAAACTSLAVDPAVAGLAG